MDERDAPGGGKMPKRKCTGANCPVQVGYGEPETCQEPEKCRYATFPQTNADRIRAMTDRELAEAASGMTVCFWCPVKGCRGCAPDECTEAFLTWLRSPVEESYDRKNKELEVHE